MRVCINTPPVRHRSVLILLAVVALCPAPCTPAFEFEYWPKAIVMIPIDKQWQFGFEEWLSFADNASRFKDTQMDFWLTYLGLADWLSVGVGYKTVLTKADDDWRSEDRPMLNAAVKTKVRGFGVVDRSRLEYRIPEDQDEVWRYRNRLTVSSPVTFTPLKVQPYVAEEVFFTSDGQGFNQQRLYGGVSIPLHEKVRLELFYIWKLDRSGDEWHDTNVLGSWVYFQF
jgi:hypothetical protein